MAAMGALVDWAVADGKVVLLAVAILVLEAVVAFLILGRGRLSFAANWISGLSLLGAVYVASVGLGSIPLLGCLSVAFVSHVLYLASLRRGR